MAALSNVDGPWLFEAWQRIVNPQGIKRRDVAIFKRALEEYSPAQLLYGFYKFCGRNITVPQFLARRDEWFLEDDLEARVELALCQVDEMQPVEYLVYLDNRRDVFNPESFARSERELVKWTESILAGVHPRALRERPAGGHRYISGEMGEA